MTKLNEFWDRAFADRSARYTPMVAFHPWPPAHHTKPSGQNNPFLYSAFENGGPNQMIYDPDEVQWSVQAYGVFGPVVAVAHEWGHYIQRVGGRGMPDIKISPGMKETGILHHGTLDRELDADRLAGAFIGWLVQVKRAASPGCLEVALKVIGHYVFPDPKTGQPDYHGDEQQRQACVRYGYTHGPDPFVLSQPGGSQLPVPCNTRPAQSQPARPGTQPPPITKAPTGIPQKCGTFAVHALQLPLGSLGQRQSICSLNACVARGGRYPTPQDNYASACYDGGGDQSTTNLQRYQQQPSQGIVCGRDVRC
jgi:hypothetical protein